MEIEPGQLSEKDLKHIEHMADTRFNCNFWGAVSVKRAIKQLLMHIKYQESKIQRGTHEPR
jgi:lipopolysaccharide biosynthesis protein